MVKIVGAVLVLLGCGCIGGFAAACHNRELKTLQKLASMLDLMSCELQYRLTPLPELCTMAAKEGGGMLRSLFSDLATELECQICPDVRSCMQIVLNRYERLPEISRQCLEELGCSMGRFDLSGQLKGLEAVRQQCRREMEMLNEDREARLRSYRTLGVCAGAALVILFV